MLQDFICCVLSTFKYYNVHIGGYVFSGILNRVIFLEHGFGFSKGKGKSCFTLRECISTTDTRSLLLLYDDDDDYYCCCCRRRRRHYFYSYVIVILVLIYPYIQYINICEAFE